MNTKTGKPISQEVAQELLSALRDICLRYDESTSAYKIADEAISKAEGRA